MKTLDQLQKLPEAQELDISKMPCVADGFVRERINVPPMSSKRNSRSKCCGLRGMIC